MNKNIYILVISMLFLITYYRSISYFNSDLSLITSSNIDFKLCSTAESTSVAYSIDPCLISLATCSALSEISLALCSACPTTSLDSI